MEEVKCNIFWVHVCLRRFISFAYTTVRCALCIMELGILIFEKQTSREMIKYCSA